MFLVDLLFAIILTFIVCAVFLVAGSRGPWNNLGILFAVVLLITWAGGVWLTPFGPALWGGYWLPFLIIALLAALLLAAVVPHKRQRDMAQRSSREPELSKEEAAMETLGITFWVFICLLIGGIALAYFIA